MNRLRIIMEKLTATLSRYRDGKFTGKITVTFNFSQGTVGDMDFSAKHKFNV